MGTLADRVRQTREDLGLSQEQLAYKAGVSQGTIGNIESGLRKKPRELVKIATALEVRPEWLDTGATPRKLGEPGQATKYGKNSPGWTAPGLTKAQLTVSALLEEHLSTMSDEQCKAVIGVLETFQRPIQPAAKSKSRRERQ